MSKILNNHNKLGKMKNNNTLYYFLMLMMLSFGMTAFTGCSSDDDPFITASEDDEPRILDPYFPDWSNGVPGEFKNITRDVNLNATVVVTPVLFTTVKWYIDEEEVAEGLTIDLPLIAGEYMLKVVATTTKGKETSRQGRVIVRPLDSDPNPGNDIRDRQVVPGSTVKLHGTHMEKVTKVCFGGAEIDAVFVENGSKSYVEYTVPQTLPLGTYRLTLKDVDGITYGGGTIVVSDEAPVVMEETLWEGSFDVTWGTPFTALQNQFASLVSAGSIVRAYVTGNGQGCMATAWWNNILTGEGDPNRGDVTISGDMVLEYQLTDLSIQLMNDQKGALFVGDGYTIKKITVE